MPSVYFKGFCTVDRTHKSNTLYDIELVKRDLLNILHTRKGERVMMPNYGTIIWDMLFEPLTTPNKDLIIDDVATIVNSDPRTQHIDTQITDYEQGLRIQITLKFEPQGAIDTMEIDFDKRIANREE